MKIAILGWGSLIWNPRDLEIDKTEGKNGWYDDGPMLPIEFARISQDDRLTLVIVPGEKKVQTLYAISKFEEIDHAILDLAVREGCGRKSIGFYNKTMDNFEPASFEFKKQIKCWINNKKLDEGIDAVIWTNLTEKLKDKNGKEWNKKNIIEYLNSLPSNKFALAEQYVRRTPAAIDTKIRKELEAKLDWHKIV
jgi:hypothetical protein